MTASTDTRPTTVVTSDGEHITPAPKPARQSRASKSAARNAKPAAGKPAPAKVTKINSKRESIAVNRDGEPKAPKGDGTNGLKVKIADALIDYAGAWCTPATAKALGVPLDLLKAEVGRTLSYAPGPHWHKNLTSPGTGRGQRHVL
jgi:hypothetical protein